MIQKMNQIDEIHHDMKEWTRLELPSKINKYWWAAGGDIFEFYKKVLNMKHFELKKAGDDMKGFTRNEVWTDGYCVMVELSQWNDPDFHEELQRWIKK